MQAHTAQGTRIGANKNSQQLQLHRQHHCGRRDTVISAMTHSGTKDKEQRTDHRDADNTLWQKVQDLSYAALQHRRE